MKILITGASGWLGRNSIRYFLNNGFASNNLILVGSRNRKIEINKDMFVEILDFEQISNLINNEELMGIIHLAYLTKDYSNQNLDNYIKTNLELTNKIVKILHLNRPTWMVYVSSGAIYSNYEKQLIENDIKSNPYGYLKYRDEIKFTETCKILDINLTIGRLWGSMGIDFINAKKYAVGEFMINALTGKDIIIKSNRNVYRTYCDSEQFVEMCIRSAISIKHTLFDSKGEIVEIEKLAVKIKELLNPKINIIRDKFDKNLTPDDYYARNDTFFDLSRNLNLEILSLKDQIIKSATYIQSHLNI